MAVNERWVIIKKNKSEAPAYWGNIKGCRKGPIMEIGLLCGNRNQDIQFDCSRSDGKHFTFISYDGGIFICSCSAV